MFVRPGKILVVIALVAALGAHWALLQTVAWTTMLANNLQCGSFCDAVAKTFDGKHPCCLCRAIEAGEKSEKKNEFITQSLKFEFPLAEAIPIPIAPANFKLLPQLNSFAESFLLKPPTSPPRGVPA